MAEQRNNNEAAYINGEQLPIGQQETILSLELGERQEIYRIEERRRIRGMRVETFVLSNGVVSSSP